MFILWTSSAISWATVPELDSVAGRSTYLDSVELISKEETTNTLRRIDVLIMLGRLYIDRDMEKAKTILHESASLADSLNYPWGKVQAFKYLGIIHDYQGYIAVSADYFKRAIAILREDTSQRFLAERLYLESYPAGRVILWPLTKQLVLPRDSSIARLIKCIEIKDKLNDRLGVADAYDRLAFEYWDRAYQEHTTGDYERAMEAWRKEKEEYAKAHFEDGVAFATGKIAVGYEYLGDSAEAVRWYRRGYKLNEAIGNKMYMARNTINLARMSLKWRKVDSAKYFFKSAIHLATDLQVVVVTHQAYLQLARLYEAEGDYKAASECYYKLFQSRDLHFTQSHLLTMVEMKSQFEDLQKADRIRRLELENKVKEDALQRRYLVILFLLILTVLIVVGSYLFLRGRRRYLARLNEIETRHRLKNEKDRISKELHDNIGTRLTTLTLSLRELERKSTISSPAMELIRNDVQTVIAELRDSIWAINENEITLEEFSDKVRNLFWRFQQDNGSLNCKVSLLTNHEQVRLKPQVAINLFRIVQEAVANSIKHSGASELSAIVKYDHPANLNVVISDNGTGFEVNSNGNRNSHFGLQNMRSRAKEIGASLEIDSSKGTSISILVTLTTNP